MIGKWGHFQNGLILEEGNFQHTDPHSSCRPLIGWKIFNSGNKKQQDTCHTLSTATDMVEAKMVKRNLSKNSANFIKLWALQPYCYWYRYWNNLKKLFMSKGHILEYPWTSCTTPAKICCPAAVFTRRVAEPDRWPIPGFTRILSGIFGCPWFSPTGVEPDLDDQVVSCMF